MFNNRYCDFLSLSVIGSKRRTEECRAALPHFKLFVYKGCKNSPAIEYGWEMGAMNMDRVLHAPCINHAFSDLYGQRDHQSPYLR
jgi:hypothetical protein